MKVALHNCALEIIAHHGAILATQLTATRTVDGDASLLLRVSEDWSRLEVVGGSDQSTMFDARAALLEDLSRAGVEANDVASLRLAWRVGRDRARWVRRPSGDWLHTIVLTMTLSLHSGEVIEVQVVREPPVPDIWLAEYGLGQPETYTNFHIHRRDEQ